MAQAEVNSIAETMRAAAQRQVQEQQLQQQALRDQEVVKDREARIKVEHDKLDQENTHFNASHDLAVKAAGMIKQMNQYKILEDKAAIAKHIMGGGQVPGDVQSPVGSGTGGADFSPAGGMADPNTSSVIHQIPMGDGEAPLQMQLPSPIASATQQANLARITNAPGEETKIKVEAAKQAEIEKAKIEQANTNLDKLNASKQYDDKRAAEMKAADDARNRYTQSQENYRARLMANSRNGSTDADLSPYMAQALNGELTQEGIRKLPLKPADQMKVLNGVISTGGKVLNESSKNTLMDMGTISTAIPHLTVALDLLKNNPTEVRLPGTDAFKRYQEAIQQVELVLPQVGRVIAGDKGRMSNQQIKYAEGSFIPSRNPFTSDYKTNLKNVQDFVGTMNDIVKNHTVGMSDAHKALLKQNFGIKPLMLGGTPEGASSSSSGPTHIYFDAKGNQVAAPTVQ